MTPATASAEPDLLVVLGATGTGKSELSLALAEASASAGMPAEIINGDAMQLYRGMDIGTAKLPPAERRGIPHHLLDVLAVTEDASVAEYQRDARGTIEAILARGHRPILVGGSGLYLSSVLYPFSFPERDPAIRAELETQLEEEGIDALFARLEAADASAAAAIGPHNARRIIRALEVVQLGGTISGDLPDTTPWRPFRAIGLQRERAELVARLDDRVLGMWRHGLPEEVEQLIGEGFDHGTTARKAIGYAQARAQLAGELTETEAIEQTQALTRRYARRQVSWFRRYTEIIRLDAASTSLVPDAVSAAGIPWGDGH
jgi:tRNA dimethylallyltransferase